MNDDFIEKLVLEYGKSRELFILTASELYHSKSVLRQLLPTLSEETSDEQLKHTCLRVLADVEVEMFRIILMVDMIEGKVLPDIAGGLFRISMDDYLIANSPAQQSISKDWMLICNLLVIEAIEQQGFQIMLMIAHKLDDEKLIPLVIQCVQLSQRNVLKLQQSLRERLY